MIEVVFVVLSTMVLVIIVAALWWLRRLDAPGQMPTRNEASTGAPVRSPPVLAWPTPETADVARRQFLNRSIVAALGFGLGGMGASSLAFLWPSASGGFGSKINLGKVADLRAAVEAGRGFHYVPDGRLWVTEYPKTALATAKSSYGFFDQVESGLQEGLTVLYQKCTHLGCRVPECLSSQWFECPCHGSKYNRAGEKKAGPAPRGLDRFPTEISADGDVIVNTGAIILGPPIGVDTTGQEAAGPSCVGDANSE